MNINYLKNEVTFLNLMEKDNIFKVSHKNYDYLETDIDAGKITRLYYSWCRQWKDPNPNRGFEASKKIK